MATRENRPATTMVRWGPVVAGAFIGVALMALLTSLFIAIGSEATAVADNIHWFGLISVAVALFVAGLLAGWLSGVRGATSGLIHGLTAWGLILVVAVAFPFPQAFGLLETFTTPIGELGTGPLWAAFLSLLAGAVLAAIGGLIGGITARPVDQEEDADQRELAPGAVPAGAGPTYGRRHGDRRPETEERPADVRQADADDQLTRGRGGRNYR